MLQGIKLLYWKLEAFVVEGYVRLKKVSYKNNPHKIGTGLVVSLTSFPPRFNKLHLTLKGLLLQSITPDYLILWVADADYKHLTSAILDLENSCDWFVIRTCKDTRSFKKLIPALVEFPEHYIVTADDDLFYPCDWLYKLTSKISDKKEIIAHRVHTPLFANKELLPYVKWHDNSRGNGAVLFATGIGGILYPPNAFVDDVLDEEKFMKICASADDVWFFWMARKNGVYVSWSGYELNTINWTGTDASGLAVENVKQGKNDICINRMREVYGDVFTSHE
jgi:hypothetical protein